jgi:uncharacterized membrane protein YdjX (TVP38/TMEM64 family)
MLGKCFGARFARWLIGPHYDRYNDIVKRHGALYLSMALLLPIFPDDVLSLLAGSSGMTYRCFGIITVLARPPMIAITCYLGHGDIIPFDGLGLAVWTCIVLIIVQAAILAKMMTHKDRLDKFAPITNP